ncbi:fimbrial protein [Serratia marcescens]|uniref:fimbrial protein n=1 Tax=Serratia TaxID=613 RepID=UPI0018D998AC|nr:fimbrial protein [Serratia marcescens]
MKKNLLAVAVLTASAFIPSAFAADGALNITGTITDQSCTVDPDSQNKQVSLGKIAKDAFTLSKTAGAKAFNLVLKNCPATVTGATVRFDGTQVQGQSGLLQLTGAGSAGVAGGIGVQLLDDGSNVLNIGNDSRVYTLAENKDNVLGFVARYFAYDDVSVGSANATANFTIVYQ